MKKKPVPGDPEPESPQPDEASRAPGPLPPFPLGSGRDVYFWAVEPEGAEREHEDIMLRRVPSPVAHRFRGAAGARGLTHAQYLTALVTLHDTLRQRADAGDGDIAEVLDHLGLRTVSI